jgi:hypothetical protein
MTTPTNGTGSGTTALVFQAPPTPAGVDPHELDEPTYEPRPAGRGRPGGPGGPGGQSGGSGGHGGTGGQPGPGSPLRMLKGARAAAAGMKISDDQIRAVLEDPHDVQPDPNQPTRTRLHRDGLTVTTGNDGMILRVTRKR